VSDSKEQSEHYDDLLVLGMVFSETSGDGQGVYLEPTGRVGDLAARVVMGPMQDVVNSVIGGLQTSMGGRRYSVDFSFEVGMDKPFRLLGKVTVHVEPLPEAT
jgi:hypothetical protein